MSDNSINSVTERERAKVWRCEECDAALGKIERWRDRRVKWLVRPNGDCVVEGYVKCDCGCYVEWTVRGKRRRRDVNRAKVMVNGSGIRCSCGSSVCPICNGGGKPVKVGARSH